MAIQLSVAELQSFHSIDRALFTRLVTELGHHPNEAMRVIALWLWTEEIGYPSMILSARNMPAVLVDALYAEAVTVLDCIETGSQPPHTPLTFIFMLQAVTLDNVYHNRHLALTGINRTEAEVCLRAFGFSNEEQEARRAMEAMTVVPPVVPPHGLVGGAGIIGEPNVLSMLPINWVARPTEAVMPIAPMVPHGLPGSVGMSAVPNLLPQADVGRTMEGIMPAAPGVPCSLLGPGPVGIGAESNEQPRLPLDSIVPQPTEVEGHAEMGQASSQEEPGNKAEELPHESRTMFFTFSRGYHVSEEELRDYFQSKFGDVIESIHMADTAPDTQPLWARVIFRLAATVDCILAGRDRVKFVVEHKHVLCRRFIPRD